MIGSIRELKTQPVSRIYSIQWILDPTCLSSVRTPRAWAVMTPRGDADSFGVAGRAWKPFGPPRAAPVLVAPVCGGPCGACAGSSARTTTSRGNDYLRGRLGLRFADASTPRPCVTRTESVRGGSPPPRTSRFTLFPPAAGSPTRPCTPHRLAKGSDLAAPGFCVRRHKPPQPCAHAAHAPTALTDGAHGHPQAITDGCSGCFPQVRPSARGY